MQQALPLLHPGSLEYMKKRYIQTDSMKKRTIQNCFTLIIHENRSMPLNKQHATSPLSGVSSTQCCILKETSWYLLLLRNTSNKTRRNYFRSLFWKCQGAWKKIRSIKQVESSDGVRHLSRLHLLLLPFSLRPVGPEWLPVALCSRSLQCARCTWVPCTRIHTDVHTPSNTDTHSLGRLSHLHTLLHDSDTTAPSFINSARTTGPGVSVPLQQPGSGR